MCAINFSHWSNSFLAIGLRSLHLPRIEKQKASKRQNMFSFLSEWMRESSRREKGTNSKTDWKRFSVGTEIEEINCWHEFRGECTAHLLQAHISRQLSMASIYCAQKSRRVRPHLLQACFSRSCTVHLLRTVQYGFCMIFKDSLGTKFEAVQQH